ncbi:MAG: von Willebrand factor type A domain-containing protein, partial [Clostridia bacterium]|nr:von Willebrand factor type A domain-containing protein [Clostridia bacterium]
MHARRDIGKESIMTKTLKKLFAILISLSLLLALASCSAAPKDEWYGGPMNNLSGSMDGGYFSPEKDDGLDAEEDAANPGEPGLDGARPNVQENPFVATNEQSVSTLSADVDTASYAYFRKLISQSGLSFSRLQ